MRAAVLPIAKRMMNCHTSCTNASPIIDADTTIPETTIAARAP